MFSKWKIKGIETHIIAENGDLYKKPYVKNLKSYSWRKIKKQDKNRYKINGEWYSRSIGHNHRYKPFFIRAWLNN